MGGVGTNFSKKRAHPFPTLSSPAVFQLRPFIFFKLGMQLTLISKALIHSELNMEYEVRFSNFF